MLNVPNFGDRVRVWPAPNRRIQNGPRPIDAMGGGRLLADEGAEVIWSPFHFEQLRSGDLFLHDPTPRPVAKASPNPKAKEQ